jgi:predicted CoA-binding protein
MSDIHQILKSARSILLVDWADRSVPRTLVMAGFTVFTASPGRYSIVEVVAETPDGVDSCDIFPPKEDENGYLVFRRLESGPAAVDIVNVFRPEAEHAGIVANQVLPLGARVLWLQPSIASDSARALASEHGFTLVEGIDIAVAARDLAS